MIIELNANESQIQNLITVLNGNTSLGDIKVQLESALAQNEDSQSGEIPKEGDNAFIKRME